MKQKNYVGIDVSANTLVVKIERGGVVDPKIVKFDNNREGHKKLLKWITKGNHSANVCMEATGVYHFSVAYLLTNTKKVEVMIVNPKAIKHYAKALMKRAKTDEVDAGIILDYLKTVEFIPWIPPSKTCLELQVMSRRLYQLKGEITRESNRRHTGNYNNAMESVINNDIEVNLKHLKNRVKLLEAKAIDVVKSDEKLTKRFDLLCSVKGIATTSALQILSELMYLPEDMSASQWVAYAGLDPRPIESGESIHKPRRISKSGNKYLRTALYMPALVAVQNEGCVRAYYSKLIELGKRPLQAIVAVMRKLLHTIWGMFHSDTPWQAEKFYALGTQEKSDKRAPLSGAPSMKTDKRCVA